MAKHNQKLHPFSEPSGNYTKNPNVFYDDYMRKLRPAENLVFLQIERKTWGWQKAFAAISIPRFIETTGIKSKTTVKTAIEGLIRKRFVLRYETGEGSNHRTYYWINTEKNHRIYLAVVSGRLTIQEAFELTSANTEGREEVIHIAQNFEGPKTDPSRRSNFDPNGRVAQGSSIDPHKKKPKRKPQKKDGDPLLKNVDKTSEAEANAVEHLQEQRHIRRRRAEDPPGTFVPVGKLVDQVLTSFPMPEPQQ